jgi:hypothetical protein
VGLKSNGINQRLVYATNINLLEDSTCTVKKNTEDLVDVSVDIGLEENKEKLTIC